MTMLPAGWYPDPQTPDQMRYWDGAQWTLAQAPHPQAYHQPDATTPMPVYAPDRGGYGAPAPWTAAPHAPSPAAWYLRKPVLAVAAAVALLAVGSALGGETDGGQDDTAPRQAAADVAAPAETQEEPAEAAEEPAAKPVKKPAQAPAKKPATKVEAPAGTTQGQVGTEPASADGSFTLPDETGKSLQAAQDDVQAVSGNPFYVTFSDDASGDGRMQILDSGWQVCSQSPVAGSAVDEASIITFFVVRESETCP